jgi:hypothetical protein
MDEMGQIEVLMDLGEPYVRLKDYRAVQARAEAAEADADLRATERDSAIDRALSAEMQLEAAKAQLAALKAAGQWRAVTERPPTDVTIEMIVVGLYRGNNEFWDESFGAMVEPTHWRPAPPTEAAQ